MVDYFLDARVREGMGERTAVRVGQDSWTYREVQAASNRVANVLQERGIGIEDRVLLLLPDGIAFVESWCGLLKAGAVFCMGNPLLGEEYVDHLLSYTRAKAVIACTSTIERIAPALERHPRCSLRLSVGGVHEGWESYEEAVAAQSDRATNAATRRDDVAGWLFTSGTTGKPKGAMHCHDHFPYNVECYAKNVLGLGPDDVFVSVSRLFFGYATGTNLMFPFAVGGTAVLFPEKPTPDRLFDHVEAHGVTVLTNVPAMIRQMVDSPRADSVNLSSVRMCLSAGEALPAELYQRWIARWPKAEILDGIGSAEMFHIYITNRLGDVKLGSLGRIVEGYEARLVNPEGDDVPNGEHGRLWVRGRSAALGYFGDQNKTRATFKADWCVTADLMRKDDDGYYYYAGRADDMLKVRGQFVSPLEIEDCLATHPAVRECAVVGVPDDAGLTIPKAFVVVRDGHEAGTALSSELQDWAREKLARYKYPRAVAYLEALPRNDRGKVMRRTLQ